MGSNVALLGKQVINEGVINAKLGSVNLAAGKEAVLTFDQQGLLGVRISKEILQDELGIDPAVLNSGEINAEGGRVLLTASVSRDVFSQAVNHSGIEQATSVVVHEDGSFTLGGGADVVNTGDINVSANQDDAGRVAMLGENVTHSGIIKADGYTQGGEIYLHANQTALLTEDSQTSAVSGQGNGGTIKILGETIGILDQSEINTSGDLGGGEILIGGDYQGGNPHIRNSTYMFVDQNVEIRNDAIEEGNGGKTILWSDKDTVFQGLITVRGGAVSGDGGFVETSGKENLVYRGATDRSAAHGKAGELLLDPRDITIVNNSAPDDSELDDQTINFADGSGATDDFTISNSKLVTELNNGNVLLQANRDIDVIANIDASSNANNTNNLTLDRAFKKTLAGQEPGSIDRIYSSMNGEHHWAKEYGVALAAENLYKQPNTSAHLVYSSSDNARRGAIVMEKIPATANN